jgi:hypothetical protein
MALYISPLDLNQGLLASFHLLGPSHGHTSLPFLWSFVGGSDPPGQHLQEDK